MKWNSLRSNRMLNIYFTVRSDVHHDYNAWNNRFIIITDMVSLKGSGKWVVGMKWCMVWMGVELVLRVFALPCRCFFVALLLVGSIACRWISGGGWFRCLPIVMISLNEIRTPSLVWALTGNSKLNEYLFDFFYFIWFFWLTSIGEII